MAFFAAFWYVRRAQALKENKSVCVFYDEQSAEHLDAVRRDQPAVLNRKMRSELRYVMVDVRVSVIVKQMCEYQKQTQL